MSILDINQLEQYAAFYEDSDNDSAHSDYEVNPLQACLKSNVGNELGQTLVKSSNPLIKRGHGSTSPRLASATQKTSSAAGQAMQTAGSLKSENLGKPHSSKIHAFSKIYSKKTEMSSHISTSASEDSSSCERSTPAVSSKQSRSSSFEEQQTCGETAPRYTLKPAQASFERSSQNPMDLFK